MGMLVWVTETEAEPGGGPGSWGSGPNPSPFRGGGDPKHHKEGKNVACMQNTPLFSTYQLPVTPSPPTFQNSVSAPASV